MSAAGPGSAAGSIHFNRDIRPILSENCFACHGPDASKEDRVRFLELEPLTEQANNAIAARRSAARQTFDELMAKQEEREKLSGQSRPGSQADWGRARQGNKRVVSLVRAARS